MLPTIDDYKSEIKLNFGELGPLLKWCGSTCMGEWGYRVIGNAGEDQGEYEFYFADKSDYINFLLYKK